MPPYHEINTYSLCVVLASQLTVMLIIMYSPARLTVSGHSICMHIYYPFNLYLVMSIKG